MCVLKQFLKHMSMSTNYSRNTVTSDTINTEFNRNYYFVSLIIINFKTQKINLRQQTRPEKKHGQHSRNVLALPRNGRRGRLLVTLSKLVFVRLHQDGGGEEVDF